MYFSGRGRSMARRKGLKVWNDLTREEWLAFFADPAVMTELMMEIFSILYHTPGHEGRAKHIASVLGMEYRGLNAAAGWAGMKIKAWYEARHGKSGASEEEPALPSEKPAAPEAEETLLAEGVPSPEEASRKEREKRPFWEYVFNGAEEAGGSYLWILKPAAVLAWKEMEEAGWPLERPVRQLLREDVSSAGREGSLFARSPSQTVAAVRALLAEDRREQWKAREPSGRCAVCGLSRMSLLRAVSYGSDRQKGLLFCPTHGALFAAHLISFTAKGELLISKSLTGADREAMGLMEGMQTRCPFSGRRMTAHRRIFKEQEKES